MNQLGRGKRKGTMKIIVATLGLLVLGLGGVTARSFFQSRFPAMMEKGNVAVGMRNENKSLEISLVPDKFAYKPNDQITVQAMLTNSTRDTLYVYGVLGWGYSASLTFHVIDANGRDVEPQTFDDSLTPPVPRNDRSVFVKLFPQHFLGTSYHSTIDELNMKRPGKYTLFVEYHSPIPAASVELSPFWSREKGTIRSNLVRVEVVQ